MISADQQNPAADPLGFEVFPECLHCRGGDFVDTLLRHAGLVADFRVEMGASL